MAGYGADVDVVDPKGMTALHYMLKKGSDLEHFETLVCHGAQGDLPGPDGETASQIMARKRRPAFRALVLRLTG